MTTNRSNLLELAKQGNPKAIAALISRSLQSKGITAKATLKHGCLQVMLESAQVPDQQALVPFIQRGVSNLKLESLKTLRIFGKQIGEDLPTWVEEIQLQNPVNASVEQTQSSNLPLSKVKPASESGIDQLKVDKLPSEPASRQKPKLKWYETDSSIFIIGLLIFFFPLGLWSMWKYATWSSRTKGVVTAVTAILVLVNGSRFLAPTIQETQELTETTSTTSIDPNSDIGKTDQNGITITVDVPEHPSCSREYVSVKLDTFENCIIEGLTYIQVANVLGYRGELQAKSSSTEIWQWNSGVGEYLSATFSDGQLISKSQIGLTND